MRQLKLIFRIARILWKSGLLKIPTGELFSIGKAWWTCGSSFAFLGSVASIRFAQHPALHDEDGVLTFTQQWEQTENWASHLRQNYGVGPGTQVALLCRNQRSFVLGLLAVTRLGGDVLPLGPDLPEPVLKKILERQKITLVLHDPELVTGHSPTVENCELKGEAPSATEKLGRVKRPGQLITLTSGSTGIAKGIRRRPTLSQVLPAMTGLLEALPFQLHRPFLLAIPLYHGYGVATLAVSLALGAPIHLTRRYEVAPLLERLRGQEPGILVTVPTLLLRWLREKGSHPREELVAIITGSAPLSAELSNAVQEKAGPILFNLYGSSEAGLVALADPSALKAAPGTVGRPLPGNRLRILGPDGQELEAGETGRISVGGPLVLGVDREGWRETGDLGRLDEHGNLHVCGRADSMLVCGGENVFPHEVEAELLAHPEVDEVAILVIEDEEFAHRMMAAVVLRPRSEVQPAELKAWLSRRVERHKIPKAIISIGQIPRNSLGKVDRVALARAIL